MCNKTKPSADHKVRKWLKICLVTDFTQEGRGGYILNSNLIHVFESIFNGRKNVLLINSNFRGYAKFMSFRVARVVIIESKNIYRLIKSSKNCQVVFFTFGSSRLPSILVAKLMHKKIIYFVSGLTGNELKTVNGLLYKQSFFGIGGRVISSVLSQLETLIYNSVDAIVAESSTLTNCLVSKNVVSKPVLNGALFVNTQFFQSKSKLCERSNTVGYFGALTNHKGIMNFIEAIPLIIKQQPDIHFIIGGGPSSSLLLIDKRLRELLGCYNNRVELLGQISHAKMPDYLNKVKLVVLPSYGEGLPNIILESMACGTPILATPVGCIPSVIYDNITGFILEDNSPECISRNVRRALNHSNLNSIAENGLKLVEREFTYKVAVDRYKKILFEAIKEKDSR